MNILIDALKAIASPVCLEAADRLATTKAGAAQFDLHLRSAGLTDQDAATLADAMRQTAMGPGPTLRSFSASHNPNLTDAGVAALAASFPARDVRTGVC